MSSKVAVWALLILFFTAGCGRIFPKLPKQDEAIVFVWNILYDQNTPPPAIEWRPQNTLNCANDQGFLLDIRPGYYALDGTTCVGGVFYKEEHTAMVALPAGSTYATTAIQHELLHSALLIETGDADASHSDPSWGSYTGQPFSRLDLATYGLERFFSDPLTP